MGQMIEYFLTWGAVFLRLRDIREVHSEYSPNALEVVIVNMSFIKHMAPEGPLPSPLTPPQQAAQEPEQLRILFESEFQWFVSSH